MFVMVFPLAHIRRLVYGLRPPLLDQLRLIGAITSHVRQLESRVVIDLQLAPQLPPLSAAVEVALFRMVQTDSAAMKIILDVTLLRRIFLRKNH